MDIKRRMEHPVFVSLSTLTLAAAALSAIGSMTGVYDRAHVNEAELLVSHPVSAEQFKDLGDSIDEIDKEGTCRWLKSEMRALEDSIYVRRRDNGDPDYIHNLEQDLDDFKEQYKDLKCTRRLM